ncbi:MAG: hemolysin XhlA family protein [Pseudodonghicola sp.]
MTDIPQYLSESLDRAHARLEEHGARIHKLELNEAGMSEWRANTTDKLDGIQSGITWVLRIIVGGLVAAAISFIVAGGMNGAQ